jgi:alkyl hydroperoxide reductase subunit F
MLTQDLLNTIKTYTASMTSKLVFVLNEGKHAKRAELQKFLEDIASVNELISVEQRSEQALRSAISFSLEVDGRDTGIRFSGIPSGHEFNSLILAMLQATGTPIKLDESVQSMVTNVQERLKFEVFISLSCHNCPDVVQTLNQFALLNSNIEVEMIDGGLFQELIAERDIQGVPSVYVNGELFANGKIGPAELLDKLIERDPSVAKANPDKALPLQDVVIIGGGPAGVSAAIYSARKGLNVTLIADRIGGQVKDTLGIENLISVPTTTGPELSNALLAHLNEYTITLKEHLRVAEIEQGSIKTLILSSGERIQTKTLIIATGAKWRELNVPGEKENIGNGVAYCPHCDGPFFKGKDVAVIGGGNSGVEAALDLAGIVKSVTVFEFADELRADKVLVNQAESKANIEILRGVATESIESSAGKVNAIKYRKRSTDEVHSKALDGVFVQIGLVPNSGFVSDLVETNRAGEIVINDKCETSMEGIFACGDVTTVPYKQIVISMGEGAKASLSAFEYLLRHSQDENDDTDSELAA